MKKLLVFLLIAGGLFAQAIPPGPGLYSNASTGGGSGSGGTVTSASFTGGLISVATPTTTPAFTVAGTSGGVPYFNSATTWASSAALTLNALVVGGGAGAAPSSTTTGTGVLTFLGTPTSANLASVVTDETGSGSLVFGTSPAITTSLTSPSATFALLNVTPTTINAFGGATTINIGNASTTTNLLGSLLLNPAGAVAGAAWSVQGTAPTPPANGIGYYAPTSVPTAYGISFPSAPTTGFVYRTGTSNPQAETTVTAIPSATTATTQAVGDASNSVATDAFADRIANSVPTVDATSNHTLTLADGYPGTNVISMTSASANTVTIPLNASVAIPIGRWIYPTQSGTGATSLVATGGVTINSNGGLLTFPGQNVPVALLKTGTDTWSAYGTGPIVTYPTTTAINTIPYSSAANVIGTIAAVNSAVLITSSGGVPSESTTLPSGLTIPAPVFSTGFTASGSGANTLAGSTGTFITSTGLNTLSGATSLSPAARTSGVAPYWTVNVPADTGQTASTESIGENHVTATRTWATTGTVALQRERYFAGPTYASASASQTFTDPFNAYFDKPIQGTNALFTRPHTLGVIDSTSASSAITGGFVVATTLGTAATSVGIGGGNVNAGGTIVSGGAVTVGGKISSYNGVATAGWGTPVVQAAGRVVAQTAAAASIATYTVGAADGTFIVSGNVLVTTSTTHNFTMTCAYTDEGNTARVITFTFSNLGGTLLTSIANTGGAVPYEGVPLHIRVKASTAITIATAAGGTYTSVTYNADGLIVQES